jgi:hypothetical protein
MTTLKDWSKGCLLIGSLLAAGCSMLGMGKAGPETVALEVTPSQPAAQGTVTIGSEKDGNRTVEVRVHHLSPPERATAGARIYVVWLVPRAGGVPQNIGVLTLGDDLAGSLMSTTSQRDFDILVTAEENPGATSPSARNVMRASVKLTGRSVQ